MTHLKKKNKKKIQLPAAASRSSVSSSSFEIEKQFKRKTATFVENTSSEYTITCRQRCTLKMN